MDEKIYRFPLTQQIGAKSIPCVAPGDSVQRGMLIARQEENSLGANLYSSIFGTVWEVTEDVIEIQAAEQQADEYLEMKSEKSLDLIRESGLVGLGGAGFPVYAKLEKPFAGGGTVVVNAAECEPILSHNIRRIEKHPKQLLRGLAIAMEVTNAEHGVIAIKGHHREAILGLERANENPAIQIHELPDLYPMGEERAIVREVLGQLLPVTALPSEAGAIVVNAETACRIEEAVDQKKPFLDKDLTVAGKIKGNEQDKLIQVFFDVPLGASVGSLFERAGGVAEYGELLMGGPFTGRRTSMEAPVIKTTGGLIATECFPKGPEKIGLLVCACGADKKRLEEIAKSLGSEVVGVEYCKQAHEARNGLKCENPGRCPGQVQKVMALKKAGAQAVLISNCTDCTNTVMSCAPKMKLPVYHCTDGALRAVNEKIIRKMK